MTYIQKVTTYNQLDKMLSITKEIIKYNDPPDEVLKELLAACQAMKTAQTKLGWDPEQPR